MLKKSSIIGLAAAILTIVLWLILIFFNPYSNDPINDDTFFVTSFMLVFPAVTAIFSVLTSRSLLMLIAFIWSLPLSLYMLMMPSKFVMFGITSFCYLLSYIFMKKAK